MIAWRYEYEKRREKFYLWLARLMPKRLTMWAFVVVMGADGECPGEDYKRAYDYWTTKHNL